MAVDDVLAEVKARLEAMLAPINGGVGEDASYDEGFEAIKTEIDMKGLGDTYSFGFPMYAVGQCADILAFRPELVPVGEDQEAHIEMCRAVAGSSTRSTAAWAIAFLSRST